MKDGWDIRRLGDACDIVNGGTPDTGVAEYWDGSHLWITPAEMAKRSSPYVGDTERKITDLGLRNSSATMLPINSVILSSRAPIGHLVISTAPMATNQGCKGLVPGTNLLPKFLYYYLGSIVELLNSIGTGATFKEVSAGKLREIRIPVAPLPEQQRIVRILDQALDAIATLKANIEKNLQNASAVFKSHLQFIFERACKLFELIPLLQLATDITDGDHMPPPKSASGIPFVTIGNIMKRTRTIDFSDTFLVPPEYFERLKENRKPRSGDVLYTVTGSFGIPVVVENSANFCFQRHIALIRPSADTHSRWLYYLLLSPQTLEQANERATGTAQKTVSLSVLRQFRVPRVPLPDQRSAAAELDALAAKTQRLQSLYQQKLTALDELKKSLLHQAFSGAL